MRLSWRDSRAARRWSKQSIKATGSQNRVQARHPVTDSDAVSKKLKPPDPDPFPPQNSMLVDQGGPHRLGDMGSSHSGVSPREKLWQFYGPWARGDIQGEGLGVENDCVLSHGGEKCFQGFPFSP